MTWNCGWDVMDRIAMDEEGLLWCLKSLHLGF